MRTGTLKCIFLILLFFLLFPAGALAEEEESGGIRLGALTIHPSLTTAMRYEDNIYFVPDDYEPGPDSEIPRDKESDFILNIRPDLLLGVYLTNFKFNVGYNLYGDVYTGYDDPEEIHNELNAINHSFRGLVSYTAPVGFFINIRDGFVVQEALAESEEFVDYVRGEQKHNDGTATVGYRRLPNDSVYIGVSYRNITDLYDVEKFDIYNRMAHLVMLDLRLKFFPKTAWVVEGSGGTIRNPNETDLNVLIYSAMTGLVGQVTRHIQITVKGGFGVWNYAVNDDYKNFLAKGEIALVWPSQTRISAGYDHRVTDATDTNFFVTDEFYLRFQRLFFQRLMVGVKGSYQDNEFSTPVDRKEKFLQVGADLNLRILYWLYAGTGYARDMKTVDTGDESNISRNIAYIKLMAKF